jgi:hypothetical protein
MEISLILFHPGAVKDDHDKKGKQGIGTAKDSA